MNSAKHNTPHKPVYGAGHIKARATRSEMESRYDAIYEIVRENQPTGIRFTYYTAVAAGLVPKTDNGYVKVQRAILDMRRNGRIPWAWIVDNTRWMRKPRSYSSVEEALRDTAAMYRRAIWRDADQLLEVWCESESVAGVLYPITSKWDVPLYPMKGQTSDSFAYAAAKHYQDEDRPIHILYFGDHDPAGYEIESNLRAKLAEHSGRSDIEVHRIYCREQDVAERRLIGTTPKKLHYVDAVTSERVPWTGPAVEIEAIRPAVLRGGLDSILERNAPQNALRIAKMAEDSEKDLLLALAGSR